MIAVPPLVWMIQGAAGWLLVGRACTPAATPLPFATARAVLGAITFGALVAISVTLLVAPRLLGRREAGSPARLDLASTRELEIDEHQRFVAALALVAGVTLILGLLMAGLPVIFMHACGVAR